MSHYIYDGLVTLDNLGTEFNASANPITIKLDPTLTKLPDGSLKANVSGVLTGTNLALNGGAPIDLTPAIKAGETLTVMGWDAVAKKLTYKSESGLVVEADLSVLGVDIYTDGYDWNPATVTLTLKDNSTATPDLVIPLADLKKVVTSNTGSVSFTGTGEASSPLVANVTSIPAGVPIPAASLTGTVPAAVMTSSTTNVLAVTGPNLVSTVNGVVASVPMASIVPATTNTLAITKAGGAVSTVNGVVGTQLIPVGTIVETLGYDATGKAVYQATPLPADNWRTIAGGLLPDGTTDTTEAIVHGGNVRVGPGTATATNVALQVIAGANTSALNPVNPTATFTGTTSKVYYESLSAPTGARVMVMETDSGKTRFNSASDDAQAWVRKDIWTMDHVTGDLFAGGYPNTRNDAGFPKNILSTGPFGAIESHPISELMPIAYPYKNPNPSIGPVSTPTTIGATTNASVLPAGTVTFRSTNDSYAQTILLPPNPTIAMSPIVIEGNAASPVYVLPGNTDLNESILLPNGTVARFYPGSDGLWHWLDPEINPSNRVVFWPSPSSGSSGIIPPETQVFNMSDAGFYNANLTLPVPTDSSEPLTIISSATLPYTVGVTNQIAGALPVAGVKNIPLTFYPVVGQGWVLEPPVMTANVLTTVLAGPGPSAQSGAGNITSTVNGVIATAASPATVEAKLFANYGASSVIPSAVVNLGGGNNISYVKLATLGSAGTVTLPPIAGYPKLTELHIKAAGTWAGTMNVVSVDLIDGLATYPVAKTATRQPSITVMHNGTTWFVV